MFKQKNYANGQKVFEFEGNKLTYFFKNGKLKAEGIFEKDKMEGEWKFYRETGQLWGIGNFKNGMKNGQWMRYDKNDNLEYDENFVDGKIVKRKK